MKCTICREEMEPGAIFCGHCGQRLHSKQEPLSQRQPAPLAIVPGQAGRGLTMERPIVHAPLPGPQAISGIGFGLRPGHTGPYKAFVPHHNEMQEKRQYVTRELPEIDLARKELSPSALHLALAEPITGLPRGQHNTFFRSMLIFITIALLISSIGVGAYALIKTRSIGGYRLSRDFSSQIRTQVQGEVSFTDDPQTPGKSNRVTITLKQLNAPADNATYLAWLIDDEAEHITPLGQLMPRGTDYVLQRTLGATNLLSLGNRIQVTQESSKVTVPTGKIVFKADFPPLAFVHLRHLLVHLDETPGQVGLLVGLREQARQLNAQATLLKNRTLPSQAVHCVAQNILNIVEGTRGAHYATLSSRCATMQIAQAGDGFGLVGTGAYIEMSLIHVSLAATQSDSSATIKQHAEQARTTLENIREWASRLDQLAINLAQNPFDQATRQQIRTLCDQVLNGNGNKQGGANAAYSYGQLMAQLNS